MGVAIAIQEDEMTATVTIENGAQKEIEEAVLETTIEIKRDAAMTTISTTLWILLPILTHQKEIGAAAFLVQENPSAPLAFLKSNFSKTVNRVNCLFSNSYSFNKN